jgi:hypothetical protein
MRSRAPGAATRRRCDRHSRDRRRFEQPCPGTQRGRSAPPPARARPERAAGGGADARLAALRAPVPEPARPAAPVRARLDLATWLIAGADGFCGALTAGTLLTPGLREALGLVPLAAELWTLVLAAVAATWLGAELLGRAVDRSAAQPASSPRS